MQLLSDVLEKIVQYCFVFLFALKMCQISQGGSSLLHIPALITSILVVCPAVVISTRQTPAVLPRSQKMPVSPGAGHGPVLPPLGRVSRCRGHRASFSVA